MVEEVPMTGRPEEYPELERPTEEVTRETAEELEAVPKAEYVSYAGPEITVKPPPEVTTPEEVEPEEIPPPEAVAAERIETVDAGVLSSFAGPPGELPDAVIDFCYRRFSTDRQAWLRFVFPREFAEPPTVVAQVEHRDGWFSEQRYERPGYPRPGYAQPGFGIGRRWYYDLKLSLSWAWHQGRHQAYTQAYAWLRQPGGPPGFLDAPLAWIAGIIGGVTAIFTCWVWNDVISGHVGRGIREAFVNTYETEGGANTTIAQTSAQAQHAVRTGLAYAEHAAATGATYAEHAINNAIPLLYGFSGLPAMKLSPAEVRNITATSCEILGYKDSTLDIFVIGKAQNPLEAFVPRMLRQLFTERQFAEIAKLFGGRS